MTTTSDIERGQNALRKLLNKPLPAILGKYNPDAVEAVDHINVAGMPGWVWVKKADQTHTMVLNKGVGRVPLQWGLRVLIRNSPQGFVMYGEDPAYASTATVEDSPYGLPPHPLHSHSDVPSSYAGQAGKVLAVKSGEDGWEFIGPVVTSINGQTGVVVLDPDDLDDAATAHKFTSAAEIAKLAGIEALADVTDAANMAAAIIAQAGKTTPVDTDIFPGLDSADSYQIKEFSWSDIKATLAAYFSTLYGRLAAVNTWIRQQFIDGSADEVQQRVQAHSSQTADIATWENSAGTKQHWLDSLGRLFGTAGFALRNGVIALLGEQTADTTMTGMYDRNELANAALRGVVTVTLTGAGTYTNTAANKNTLFDAIGGFGGFFEITGTDATTTQIEIHIDLLANQPNYSSKFWQPFVQYRLSNTAGFTGTWYRDIVVEVSADNATWYKPASGEWETTDASANQLAVGYWFGTNGFLPTILNFRYIRFTLTDRQENAGYAFKASVWISEIGLRHMNAPWSRHKVSTAGDDLRGDYTLTANGVAASAYNTKLSQSGAAIFNEQGADVDFRIEGDTDPNAFFVDASTDRAAFGTNAPTGKVSIQSGTSTDHVNAGGTRHVNTAVTGNVTTGEDTLKSFTVPANTLSADGMSLWYEVGGTLAANGNAKTLRVDVNGTDIFSSTTGPSTEWYIRGRITRTSGTTVICSVMMITNSAQGAGNLSVTVTLTSSFVLTITGEATATNDIVCNTFTVGWDDQHA